MLVPLETFTDIKLLPRNVNTDQRGVFRRVYDSEDGTFLPRQVSYSGNLNSGTLRGMHRLDEIKQEFKVVECVAGCILDVIVDCRPYSINYLNHSAIEMSASSDFAILIPPGFAHGYITLKPDSSLIYQMSVGYDPNFEIGIRWNDPKIGIIWPTRPIHVSVKDSTWPLL